MGDLIAENITTSNLTVTNNTNVSGITISDNVTAANNITTTAGNMVDQLGSDLLEVGVACHLSRNLLA